MTDTPFDGLATTVARAFWDEQLDLSARSDQTQGLQSLPEVRAASLLRDFGASDAEVRQFLTFVMALDRARDSERLWKKAAALWRTAPQIFRPADVVAMSLTALTSALFESGVSQRHLADAAGWRTIAESLLDRLAARLVSDAILDGIGDAVLLLDAVRSPTAKGISKFPYLKGEKVSVVWIRLLVLPGRATISSLGSLPVGVDDQVKRATENLGVSETKGLTAEKARGTIQRAWADILKRDSVAGPDGLEGAAALDPALWFWGKSGCSVCEKRRTKQPISSVCTRLCRYQP